MRFERSTDSILKLLNSVVGETISKPACHLLLIIILGIIGYSNTLNAPFILDDVRNIVENPVIKNIDFYISPSKAKVYTGLAEYPMLVNRYVGSLTFALNYKINGLDVTGYHAANLLIHLINSLLVYRLIQLLISTLSSEAGRGKHSDAKHASTIALFSSLLFVSHPIQTQAVTYIVQRFASLATLFYLLATIMYIKARLAFNNKSKEDGWRKNVRWICYYSMAFAVTVFAMKTKETAFTLPVMIIVCELLFLSGEVKSRILSATPFVLTMFIIPASLLFVADLNGSVGNATRLATDMSRLDYLLTEFRVIISYIRLILFPVGQNLDHDYPIYITIFDFELFLALMSLMIIWFTVIYTFKRYKNTIPLIKVIFFGAAWFFVTLSVESSIIPIKDVIFEHRLYLPSVGFFLVISCLAVMVIERCRQEWAKKTIFFSVIIISLVLTGTTYARNYVWSSEVSLWQDVVEKSPKKPRGYIQLTSFYNSRGRFDETASLSKRAILLNPPSFEIHNNLGTAFFMLGRTNEAIKEYTTALRINPDSAITQNNLGLALVRLGQLDEAVKAFETATRIKSDFAMAYNNLGMIFDKLGRTNEAINEFRTAIQIEPDSAQFHNNLGMVLGKEGLINEAIREFKTALRLNPDLTEANENLRTAFDLL